MRQVVDSVFRGLFLISLGVVFFLNIYGILPWGFWMNIAALWPLLLIVAGVALFFNKRVPFSGVLLVFLLVLVGYSFIQGTPQYGSYINFGHGSYNNNGTTQKGNNATMELVAPLESGVKTSELELNLGGAQVELGSLEGEVGKSTLLSGTYRANNSIGYGMPEFSHQRSGDKIRMTFDSDRRPGDSIIDLKLSPQVDYDMEVNAGAVKGMLDLSQLRVTNLEMSTGASDIELKFGDTGAHTKADLSTGASKINLVVPENVGLKIKISGIASDTNFTGDGLFLSDKEWVSPNYETAKTTIEMTISMAAGKVDLQRPAGASATY
jgi:hypothetical protein